jgi:tRNA A-37 threonylcarbamoyl transferase component Bud32
VIDQYELFCIADRLFYDRVDQSGTEHPDFPISQRPVPDGWEQITEETWISYAPTHTPLPPQGWKIHISSCIPDAERVLDAVWDYCVPRGVAFKFLRSRMVMLMHNSKSAFRGSSGKLVTIYPSDESQLEIALKELDRILTGVKGPYILSDLRYGEGPLFVRYGGFAEQHCIGENGQRMLAICDADGRLVPDTRGPVFSVPSWVSLPEFLQPHLAARNAVTIEGLPYEFERVLLFSNGGGVYFGRDRRTQEQVVLKEGRLYAGLDVLQRDAVTRLAHERDILQRLAGLDVVPAVRDYFTLGDHQFLVQEFVDGTTLQQLLIQQYPLTKMTCTPQDLAEYTEWALDILGRVERAIDALHERGVVFGDLHPNNVLVTEDRRVVLIDFEVATPAEQRARSALANPGFSAPADRQGVDVDRYALACMHLALFAPLTTTLLPINRAKAVDLADVVADIFPVPRQRLQRALQTIMGPTRGETGDAIGMVRALPMPDPNPQNWPRTRDAMRHAILASATPDRDDRLFPGDVNQFLPGGGINIAYGAAGVLYALAVSGAGRFPEHESWLRTRALRPDAHGDAVGFYDGLPGVAYVLDLLGHRQDALDIMDTCTQTDQGWDRLELSLFAGLPGLGLVLLHLGERTEEAALTKLAFQAVDTCIDRLGGPDDVPEIAGGNNPRAGLLYGSAGVALLLLHAYEHTRDAALLDKAAVALRQDLRRCTTAADGSLQVHQGWRTLPYLDEGSAGIGLVIARYLEHRKDEEFSAALDAIRPVTRAEYFVQSGLFTGRSGLLACRATGLRSATATDDGTGDQDTVIAMLIRGLRWHAMPYGGGLAFSGDQLLRLSMDFATGTAGVLFALATVLHDQPVCLPWFNRSAAHD